MQIQITCVEKIRNNSGGIKSYVLQDSDGHKQLVSKAELIEMMHYPPYDFVNLKLSADGKIIDKTPTCILTPQDYAAALFRSGYETKGKSKAEIKIAMQKALQTELATGKVFRNTLGISSDNLELIYTIHSMKTSSGICPVTGYVLRNIGNAPIPYKRIDTESGQESILVIQPNETKALTRLETTTLLMDVKFSFKIRNAKMCTSNIGLGRHEDMVRCYLYTTVTEFGDVGQILYTELPESEKHRFCKSEEYGYKF